MWIDGDLLEAIKQQTKLETGTTKGYQTFLNRKLRNVFLDEESSPLDLDALRDFILNDPAIRDGIKKMVG